MSTKANGNIIIRKWNIYGSIYTVIHLKIIVNKRILYNLVEVEVKYK